MNARRTGSDPDIGTADRYAIWFILVLGVAGGGGIAAMGLITGIFRVLDPARYPIELLADIPVATGPGVAQAHGDRLVVNADGLSGGPIWLLAASDLILGLTIACVTTSFAYALYRVAQRKPFHRHMRNAAIVAGCAIAFGGLLYQGIGGFGAMMAADELNESLGGVAQTGFLFQPLIPVVGFAILALAYVFQAGYRLQRETDGLV